MKGAPLYCTKCGSKLETDSGSCPECGRPTNTATSLMAAKKLLFDQRRRSYVIVASVGPRPKAIQDQEGKTIGYVRFHRPSGRLDFLETDGTTISAIIEPGRDSLNITDGGHRLLGCVKIEGSVLPVAHLEDADGKGVCEVECYKWTSISWKYRAHDLKGGLVAEMDRVSRLNDKYSVVVHGDSIDRRLLVPFAMVTMAFLSKQRGKPSTIGWFAGGIP